MARSFLFCLVFGIFGYFMSWLGYGYRTWQFYPALSCLVAVRIVSLDWGD